MATKKKNRKQRYFGTEKIKQGGKVCWLARQDKHGWALGMGLNTRNVWLTGLRFKNVEEVKRVLGVGVVFIHTKNDPGVI